MNEKFENLFIFEMANNHQGSVEHGLKIIHKLGEVCRKYQLNAAVKFQYRDLDTIIHPDYIDRTDVKHIPRFLATRLSKNDFYTMVCEVHKEGMLSMCTPFDEPSVDVCMDHGIDIIKVASCSATDWPLLETIAKTKRPVIISSGGKSFSEIDNIYSFMMHRQVDFALMHCVGLYPVGNEYVQLDCIDRMKSRYPGITIGYSGHENPKNFLIAQMAIAKGAKILERHVGLATDKISLNSYSTDVHEIDAWIEAVITAQKVCGTPERKLISNEELASMNELARGCYAAAPIKKGQALKRSDVFFAMPCFDGQMTSGMFQEGVIASKDYGINDGIYEARAVSATHDIYSIIHDVKGMLYEAKIAVGDRFELELSHHYGVEHFRHYGATIINIINRKYCKKIIVILPGQQHPSHYHKQKEESFQVLSGKLSLTLDGETRDIDAGDIVTVECGTSHSFTSANGCVFEEISTTHVKNDSYYDDARIAKTSLSQRKTILKNW